MSYDIPQPLQHREEIMFRLTAQQLLYAFLFMPFAVLFMTKISADIATRITLAAIPVTIAVLFMFTHIPKKCRRIFRWFFWRNITDKRLKDYISARVEGGMIDVG
ncbi:hypothetical protein J4207_02805 [Candidatus Woesearchaeota archaeon]|nr:hypothetical protein [Candidatus Woesearchaeota archaeon]